MLPVTSLNVFTELKTNRSNSTTASRATLRSTAVE